MEMTDREMLLFSYGALKATCTKANPFNSNLELVVELIEGHLYPQEKQPEEPESGEPTL